MEFSVKPRRSGINVWQSITPNLYPHNVNFYTLPPSENISLLEFESLAIDRLKWLKAVEAAGQKYPKSSQDYEHYLLNELKKIGVPSLLFKYTSLAKSSDAEMADRRKDHISHFILRLAFCKTPDQRNWFIQNEVDLFRFRLSQETPAVLTDFATVNNLKFTSVEHSEQMDIQGQLADCVTSLKLENFNDRKTAREKFVACCTYYKVLFTEALELIRHRKVYLRDGWAYVPANDLNVLLLAKYRAHLSHSLSVAARYINQVQEEERIRPILRRLGKATYTGPDFSSESATNDENRITPEMLDGLSETSFPLCMRHLHKILRRTHHLKHGGRMQYGLFLKGIGLSLEDSLRFWRLEFEKQMEHDKFDKLYAYNIRHNYGKEGKRADYTPYSCVKIITSNVPGPQDAHGCPFKHVDPQLLKQQLEGMKLNADNVKTIMVKVKEGQYGMACTRFFEYTHQIPENSLNQIISHPNSYFLESRQIVNGKRDVVKEAEAQQRIHTVRVFSQSNENNTQCQAFKLKSENDVLNSFSNDESDLSDCELAAFSKGE